MSKRYFVHDKFRKRKLSKLKSQYREENNKVVEGLKEVLKEGDISSGYGGKQEFSRLTDIAKNIQAEETEIRY